MKPITNRDEKRPTEPRFQEIQPQNPIAPAIPDPDDTGGHQPRPVTDRLTPSYPVRLNERLETLYKEADLVKMTSLRRIAEEINRPDGEEERDLQKENQVVLKAIEIQLRLLAERRRTDDGDEVEPALQDIWQALINLPEAGAILRRDTVRTRLVQTLRQRLG